MDSQSLIEFGFQEWHPFQYGVQDVAPERKGVYAFRRKTLIELQRGSSDVMYIGRAMSDRKGPYHNIRHSLREYLHPGRSQRTKIRVGRSALEQGWEVSWSLADSPNNLECDLLRRFYREHGQLPPENKTWPPSCHPQ